MLKSTRLAPSFLCLGSFLLLVALSIAFVTRSLDSRPTALIDPGSSYYSRLPTALVEPETRLTPRNAEGFDGQFFYYLSLDPLLVAGVENALDNPAVRGRRFLLPATSFLASRLTRTSPAIAFVGIGALSYLAMISLLWTMYGRGPQASTLSASLIAGFAMTPFALLPLYKLTAENFAAALFLLSWYGFRRRWSVAGYVAAALAVLAKETYLLWSAALAISKGRHSAREAIFGSLSAVPFLLWATHLRLRFPADELAIRKNLDWPFRGFVAAVFEAFERGLDRSTLFTLVAAPLVLALLIGGVVLGWNARQTALGLFGVFSGLLVTCLDRHCWNYVLDFGRQSQFAGLAVVLLLLESRRAPAWSRALMFALGGVGLAYFAVKILLGLP